jgi:hypothetical protein
MDIGPELRVIEVDIDSIGRGPAVLPEAAPEIPHEVPELPEKVAPNP